MNFLMKAMLKKQLKQLPQEQQEAIMKVVEENPDFFMKMSKEIKQKMKEGLDQQTASMQVMMAHRNELQQMMQKQK
jgi:TRAP-type C4-dicarboxylate transport system substrate-binding protein